jgi:hypothetical protein
MRHTVTNSQLFEQLATQALKMAVDMPDAKCQQVMNEIAERYRTISEWIEEMQAAPPRVAWMAPRRREATE